MAKGRTLYSFAASRRVANARFFPPIMTSIGKNEVKGIERFLLFVDDISAERRVQSVYELIPHVPRTMP